MSEFPQHARAVIIGAGIVGNAVAWHLARLGWRDIVQVDKGPLPNPGGSTGHASSFCFPTDYNRQMTACCSETIREYEAMDVYTRCGGIETARTEERMHELRRKCSQAKAFGVDAEMVTPAQVKAMWPHIDETRILGGFHTPAVGVADPLYAGTLYREQATGLGALQSFANTEVMDLLTDNGRITGVRTSRGDIATDTVVLCGGVWSRRLAEMAGAVIPLTPGVHQMVDLGPVPEFEHLAALEYPVIRDMDAFMYERQHGGDLEIGTYAHRAIPVHVSDIPSIEDALLSPTELPFTYEDFEPSLVPAMEAFPSIVGNEKVGIKYAINGLMSFTPDGRPVIGETPEVKGLWACAAIPVKEAAAIARTLAEWMVTGAPAIDPTSLDIARFSDPQKTEHHVVARFNEMFPKFYGIIHPAEEFNHERNIRVGAAQVHHVALGGVMAQIAAWERPNWYESNAHLVEEFGDRVMDRTHEWDRRWWSPIINAEHLALRERVGLIENPAFAEWDITGPGALAWLQHLLVGNVDIPVGRLLYTQMLTEAGGIKADVIVLRLGETFFRVLDAGFAGGPDRKWAIDHLPADGSVNFADVSTAWSMIALWGPRARDVLATVTPADVSNEALPYGSVASIEIESVRVWAARLSYDGELGWELHVPFEQGAHLWDVLMRAGKPFGIAPVGLAAYGGGLRVEKSMRLMANELEMDRNLVESGLARPRVKEADFIGKAAYLRQRAQEPANLLCTLVVDDLRSSTGEQRWMQGREPICRPDGTALADRNGRISFVTTAATGVSVGRHLLMAYLPTEEAVVGNRLAVEYIGELYPVTVAAVGATAVFDPEHLRMKG